jgi:hypothetical protein
MKKNVAEAIDIIKNLKSLLANALWKNQNEFLVVRQIYTFLEICHLFENMINKNFPRYESGPIFSIKAVAHKVSKLNATNFSPFLKLFSKNDYFIEQFNSELTLCSDMITMKTSTMASVKIAHFLFTNVVLIYGFKKLEPVFQTIMNKLVREMNLIFERYNHPRKTLTSKFFERDLLQFPKKPPPTWVNLDNISTADLNLNSFLQNHTIVHFIEMGSKLYP